MKYFEEILELKNEQSRKTAWVAFAVMAGVSLVLAGAIFAMTPLKRTEVRLLVVDKNTGYPTEITQLADFPTGDTKQMQASEALNKYFVQSYIIAHDSYNHYNVRDAYRTVQLMSSEDVFRDYTRIFEGANDIQKVIGKERQLEVVVHSMNPLPQPTEFNGDETAGKMIQARIEKIIRKGSYIEKRATGTVTVSFGYDANLRMDEESRNFNPLGFTVTAYQWTPDQRVEDFPVKTEFHPEPQKPAVELISPKTPETAPQDSVSPASAAVSGQVENSVPQSPETAPQGLPTPAVADNSGQGQPENKSDNPDSLSATQGTGSVSGSTNNTEQTQGESK